MAREGQIITSFEQMPRPSREQNLAEWLVPARNNIQRQMLLLRPLIELEPNAIVPTWVIRSRCLVLGSCFSLWRAVFQTRRFYEGNERATYHKEGLKCLDDIIHNNAATYMMELNAWSLEYYVENAVYRLRHAREMALDSGFPVHMLPTPPHMLGEAKDPDDYGFFPHNPLFSPFGEWEQCFHAAHEFIGAMNSAVAIAAHKQHQRHRNRSD